MADQRIIDLLTTLARIDRRLAHNETLILALHGYGGSTITTASVTLTFDQLAEAGLSIKQSIFAMGPGEWYCDTQGPFATPESAALAGITRVIDRYHDCRPIWDDDSDTAALRGVRSFARRTPIEAEEPM